MEAALDAQIEIMHEIKIGAPIFEKLVFGILPTKTFMIRRAGLENNADSLFHAFVQQFNDKHLTVKVVRARVYAEITEMEEGKLEIKQEYDTLVKERLKFDARYRIPHGTLQTVHEFLQSFSDGSAYGKFESVKALAKIYSINILVLDVDEKEKIIYYTSSINKTPRTIILYRKGTGTSNSFSYWDSVIDIYPLNVRIDE